MYDLTVKSTVTNYTVNCLNITRLCILLTQLFCGGLNGIMVMTMMNTVFWIVMAMMNTFCLLDSNDYDEHSLSSGW